MPRTFAETDVNAAPLATKPTKSTKVSGATSATTAPDSGTTDRPLKFVCVPRPFWDFRLEYNGESDDSDEHDCTGSPWEKKWADILKEARKTWLKPATEFPGNTWMVYWTHHHALYVIII
jgi:hypothetical protein